MEQITINEAINQGLRIIKPNLPARKRAFKEIKDDKDRAVCILYMAGFTYTKIDTILKISVISAKRCVAKHKALFPHLKRG